MTSRSRPHHRQADDPRKRLVSRQTVGATIFVGGLIISGASLMQPPGESAPVNLTSGTSGQSSGSSGASSSSSSSGASSGSSGESHRL